MATDDAARRAVCQQLGTTLFVEAGAGSGKTTCLVGRFVALVEDGVEADRIAAITFTEKAAGELADRIRSELQRRAATSQRCRAALGGLDRAAICTLHAFAQRILTEHPIEAGLPPRVTVLDEIASQVAFEEAWAAFLDRAIEDPVLDRPLRLLLAGGARLDHLHQVAVLFAQNWDLVAERNGDPVAEVPPIDLGPLLAEVDAVVAMGKGCADGSDKLLASLDELAEWAVRLRTAQDDDDLVRLLGEGSVATGVGRAANWPDVKAVRAGIRAVKELRDNLRDGIKDAALVRLAQALAAFTVEVAEDRRRAGELAFHDLLVLARSVLRDPRRGVAVRAALAERYQRLLLDEFQDTDPIQVELAVLIASRDPDAAGKHWVEVTPEPGRLFVVGDPKQSIYRFRRADIAVFLRARDALGGRVESLRANFRTAGAILAWVNHTFGRLIRPDGESQPAYQALDPTRENPPRGPAVAFLGMDPHPKAAVAEDLRTAEAADVAGAIHQVVTDGWAVEDRVRGGWRAACWSDIAVLLPARTSLPALESALADAGIPYRAETSSLVYGTAEVRDLLLVARAVEDPTDSLAVVSALRSAAFGCGDDDLYRWRQAGGRWDHQAPVPEGTPAEDVVAEGLAWLGSLHRERLWLSPSQVLERIVRERRLMEVAFVHPRPRDLWRRLRFVLDQCRAWEEAGGATLRDYLAWARLQGAEGARVIEAVLPETDDDAVRILTVHGAKGLEFPVTVLSGLTTRLTGRQAGVQVYFPPGGHWAVHLTSELETAEFAATRPLEEQLDHHERLRLLYVAATRARDHLIVSVHRKAGAERATAAEVLHRAGWDQDLVADLRPRPVGGTRRPPPRAAEATADLPPMDRWRREYGEAFARATRPVAVSATRLAEEAAALATAVAPAGLSKDPRDVDLPPWQKGRYGTAIGRAVHGVLQSVDLATGEGLPGTCAAQAAAEGVLGQEAVIEGFCRSALAAQVVQEAARRPHWREVYVGIPRGDGVLEGYIDLLYRDDHGLVIVDYKTDHWRDEADLDARVQRYRVQLGAYAEAIGTVTAAPVSALWLVFLHPGGPARPVTVAPTEP